MNEFLVLFTQVTWRDILDIAMVTFVVYQTILLVKGTRAMHMLMGLGVVFVALIVSQLLGLLTINWIINSFLSSLILVVIIIFQNDIRRALARMGRGPFFGSEKDPASTLEEVVRTAVGLASRMTGGLMVLERHIGLNDYVEIGSGIDALVSRELLIQIFQTSGPLHDGAVIISGDRLLAARCVLPLSGNPALGRHLGTRHRAALGLSEETDAVCVVISEERGRVSVAVGGKLTPDLDAVALRNLLFELFEVGTRRRRGLFNWGKAGA
ncbi:MAG: diadenylate cyclase CdaA [Pseudomonadota bacterium]